MTREKITKPLKITYTEGCIYTSFAVETADGQVIDIRDMSKQQMKQFTKLLLDNEKFDVYYLQEFIMDMVERYADESKNLGTCEECGDTVYKHTLELK